MEFKDNKMECKTRKTRPMLGAQRIYCISNNYRFTSEKPVFGATTTTSTKTLVNLTGRYSEEAHRFCAEAGVALG